MRKATVAVAALTVATAGSAMFGGAALAGGWGHGNGHGGDYGGNGTGGKQTNNCLNIGLDLLSGIGLGGEGKGSGASCSNSGANGTGGSAY